MTGAVRTRALAPLVVTSLSFAGLIGLSGLAGPAARASPAPPGELAPLAAAAPAGAVAAEPGAALRAGNRLFRRGDFAGAVEAYRRAAPEALASDPVLAYNLATALHRLGRLPEAVLWYRRAAERLGTDPWLADNLERARASLAAPRLAPPPLLAPVLLHPWLLPGAAAAAAWAALLLQVARGGRRLQPPRPGRPDRVSSGSSGAAVALLTLGALLWVVHLTLPLLGPRPAVLLAPCGDALPAGSEVWARPDGGPADAGPDDIRTWSVDGPRGTVECGGDAVAPL